MRQAKGYGTPQSGGLHDTYSKAQKVYGTAVRAYAMYQTAGRMYGVYQRVRLMIHAGLAL